MKQTTTTDTILKEFREKFVYIAPKSMKNTKGIKGSVSCYSDDLESFLLHALNEVEEETKKNTIELYKPILKVCELTYFGQKVPQSIWNKATDSMRLLSTPDALQEKKEEHE